ncbi:c-type cytochrome [Crenalkalicoccus roseus]|uniref:c-type cytochrome n=1 Tax=Crenalkalicoccus roseus TaxID=1485588 RepID=UPI0013053694|nr:cytochrome c [Crenalkalicoccus roseus]
MRRIRAALAALTLAAPLHNAAAQGAAQAERIAYGRAVAEAWCANCHITGPGRTSAPVTDAAPPFQAIADAPAATAASLRAFLLAPHAPMPDYQLSEAELDGVIAYILSLRRR